MEGALTEERDVLIKIKSKIKIRVLNPFHERFFSPNKARHFDSDMEQPQSPRSGHFIFFEARVTSSVCGSLLPAVTIR